MSTRAIQIDFLLAGITDSVGNILAGGSVSFFAAGTGNTKAVYTEKEKTNPFVTYTLDASGAAHLYGDGIYKVLAYDSLAVLKRTWDNVKIRAHNYAVVSKTATYTVTVDDDVVLVDTSSGHVTLNFPAAASMEYPVEVIHTAGANNVVIDPNSTELVQGASTYTFSSIGSGINVISDGSALRISQSVALGLVPGATVTLANTGLHILDSNATHDLIIKPGSNLTADKTLTITTGDSDRDIVLTNIYTVDASEADQGVAGSGKTIMTYVDAIGATKQATIFLPHSGTGNTTTYTLTTSETIPSNITLKIENGAIVDGAGTLTINGPFESDLSQAFGSSITISFGVLVLEVYPQWWGAVADGATDDATAIQAALDASIGLITKLPHSGANSYLVGAPIVINTGNRLIGSSPYTTTIKLDAGVDDNVLESDTWTAQAGWCHRFEIANLVIDGNKANNASTSSGIAIYGMGEVAEIHNVFIGDCNDYGLQLAGVGAPSRNRNVTIQNSGVAAILSSQTGGSVTSFDSISGDDNIIFAKFTGGPVQAVFINPKIEGEHDPVFDCTFADPSGSLSQITVIGGYAQATVAETDVFKTDTAGGTADSVSATFINFRQYNYTNLFNDVDNSVTYATGGTQSFYGLYQFMAKNRIHGDLSEIFLPYSVPIVCENSVEGTEFEMIKQTGEGLRFQSANPSATANDFSFRGVNTSGAQTLLKLKTTDITCSGASETWVNAIPAGSMVLGLTARVTTLVTGATSIDIGDADTDLFIDGMAVALNTTADLADSHTDFTGPKIYRSDTNITVTGVGGAFTAGVINLVLHYIELGAPTS